MQTIEKDYETYLVAVAEMLTAEDMDEAASLLRMATTRMVQIGYDNWNGGTTIWTIYLTVRPETYARLSSKLESMETQINKRLKDVLKQFTDDWCSVSLAPLVEPRPEWREARGSVSRETRQNIVDGLKIDDVSQLTVGGGRIPRATVRPPVVALA